jgi:hypothetical protein
MYRFGLKKYILNELEIMSEKDVQQQAAKAAEFESEEFTFQDDEQRARYYKSTFRRLQNSMDRC